MDFQLEEWDPRPQERHKRRIVLIGLLLLILALDVFVVLRTIVPDIQYVMHGTGSPPYWFDPVLLALLVLMSVELSIGVIHLGPGAKTLRIDSDGLTFEFASGRKYVVKWADPRLHLSFEVPLKGSLRDVYLLLANTLPMTFAPAEAVTFLGKTAQSNGARLSPGRHLTLNGYRQTLVLSH
jgi:hypothetical protein